MKKILLLSAAFLAATQFAQAQAITLTAATHMPQADTFRTASFMGMGGPLSQLPASGANVTWDYTTITATTQDTMRYFNCIPQANCATFSNATLLYGSPADSNFTYYKTTANAFQLTGSETRTTDFYYTDPYDLYRFPFTYNTQYVENFSANYSYPGATIVYSGTDSVSGAGYGTLITPYGTTTDVLMLRSQFTYMYVQPTQRDTFYYYRFQWFAANNRYPLMSLSYSTQKNPNGSLSLTNASGSYRISAPTAVSPTAQPNEQLFLAPNPSTDNTRLDVPASFATRGANVVITDITGKTVFTQALNGATSVSIATEGWAKGLYLVRLQNAEGKALMNKLSVQ